MLHRCSDTECPFVGQVTSKSCGCHRTDEQVLTAEVTRLRSALQKIADDFQPSNKTEDGLALDEIREFALSSIDRGGFTNDRET